MQSGVRDALWLLINTILVNSSSSAPALGLHPLPSTVMCRSRGDGGPRIPSWGQQAAGSFLGSLPWAALPQDIDCWMACRPERLGIPGTYV